MVSTGGAPLPRSLPDNVRAATFLPYDELRPRCDLMITNGGYGGVNLALRHGVPLVVAGASEDKQLVAQRVTWSGAGVGIHRRQVAPRRLRRAASEVLDEPRYRNTAQEMAHQMATTQGVHAMIDAVDRA